MTAHGLEMRDVSVRFGGVLALDGVSLAVPPGKIVGLIGPNGAGKTTLLDVASGFLVPEHGIVALCGVDVTPLGPDARARAGLARSFQDCRLYGSLTVSETLLVASEQRLGGSDTISALLGLGRSRRAEREARLGVDAIAVEFGLGAYSQTLVEELSTGTRRIVDVACLALADPQVLILDEPSSGIAQRETEALAGVLRKLHGAIRAGMLVVEHDMPLLFSLADAVYVMESGRLIAHGTPEAVRRNPDVLSAYLGASEVALGRTGPD